VAEAQPQPGPRPLPRVVADDVDDDLAAAAVDEGVAGELTGRGDDLGLGDEVEPDAVGAVAHAAPDHDDVGLAAHLQRVGLLAEERTHRRRSARLRSAAALRRAASFS